MVGSSDHPSAFRWRGSISDNRVKEIDAWLETLTPDQREMVHRICEDEYNEGYDSGICNA